MASEKESKSNFIERTFGDDSRNPFHKSKKGITLQKLIDALKLDISENDIHKYVTNPEELPRHKLEFITANLKKDESLLNKLVRIIESKKSEITQTKFTG